MKSNLLFLMTIGLFHFMYVTYSIAEESLFVQPFQAKIYAKPSITSEVVGTVDSGFQFVSTGKEGNWVKLVFKAKHGFIPVVQVKSSPPLGKRIAQSAEIVPRLGARARTSGSSAVVAGMKGLTYEDRARVSSAERSDLESLDKVDSLKISPDEFKQFQLEGGKQ